MLGSIQTEIVCSVVSFDFVELAERFHRTVREFYSPRVRAVLRVLKTLAKTNPIVRNPIKSQTGKEINKLKSNIKALGLYSKCKDTESLLLRLRQIGNGYQFNYDLKFFFFSIYYYRLNSNHIISRKQYFLSS